MFLDLALLLDLALKDFHLHSLCFKKMILHSQYDTEKFCDFNDVTFYLDDATTER